MLADMPDDSSSSACFVALLASRCTAILSLARSTPVEFFTLLWGYRWSTIALVEVVDLEVVVAVGGEANLDGGEAVVVLADLEEVHMVERAAVEVEDEDELVLLAALECVGQPGRGGSGRR